MHKFDKYKYLHKIRDKNNKKTKILSIIISVVVLVGAIIFFSFARFESIQTFKLIDGTIPLFGPKLTTFLINLNSPQLVYDGIDTLGEYGTSDNNLRYIGQAPNNYVYFNCSTTDPNQMDISTCEKWRIVGLFNNVEDENGLLDSRVKLSGPAHTGYSWDTSDYSVNRGYGINQWGESTYEDGTFYEGADLMRELNNDYLGNVVVGTDGNWYSSKENEKASSMFSKPLTDYSQSMIDAVKWYTGLINYNDGTTAPIIYRNERNSSTNKNCSGVYCNDKVVRTTSWIGKIALVYESDFLYATSGQNGTDREICFTLSAVQFGQDNFLKSCQVNDWLGYGGSSIFTLTADSGSGGYVYRKEQSANVTGFASSSSQRIEAVFPSLYLKTNVMVFGGDGSSGNPYKIGI